MPRADATGPGNPVSRGAPTSRCVFHRAMRLAIRRSSERIREAKAASWQIKQTYGRRLTTGYDEDALVSDQAVQAHYRAMVRHYYWHLARSTIARRIPKSLPSASIRLVADD